MGRKAWVGIVIDMGSGEHPFETKMVNMVIA